MINFANATKDIVATVKKKIPLDELSPQERQAKYSASSYFKKKNEDATAFLKEHPIPKEFIKR